MKLTQTGDYLEINGSGNFVLTKNDRAIQMDAEVKNVGITCWWFHPITGGFRAKFKTSVAALKYIWR